MKMSKEIKKRQRKIVKRDITESQFYALLDKACQPVKKPSKSDSVDYQTSESHQPDDYNGTNTR
jgi:hypothetical protein